VIDSGQIPEEEKTPLVMELLHLVQQLTEDNQRLKDEIARLKEHKGKPKIPPSRLLVSGHPHLDPQDISNMVQAIHRGDIFKFVAKTPDIMDAIKQAIREAIESPQKQS
jgi:exonuclease V gamma subunit